MGRCRRLRPSHSGRVGIFKGGRGGDVPDKACEVK